MVIQKRKIETDQDRVGGFSTLNNNFSYFSNQQNTAGTTYQQTVEDYTETEEQQEFSTQYDSPTTIYEGESEYTANDMPTTDGESEFAFVKTFMPNVERRYETTIEEHTERKFIQKTKVKLNARGKILVCAYSVIACLLVAFCVYNAIAISNIKNSLVAYEQEYSATIKEVSTLQGNYDELNNVGANQTNFIPVSESNTVKVQLDNRPTFIAVNESTNWFDKLCNFFSNLF